MNHQKESGGVCETHTAQETSLTDATIQGSPLVGFENYSELSNSTNPLQPPQVVPSTYSLDPVANVAPATAQHGTLAHMRAAKRWLVWKNGKQPFYVNGTPRQGNLDTEADWNLMGTFAEACAAVWTSEGRFVSPGFALGPDGRGGYWQGVDFDKVPDEFANKANALPGYVETSPSGKGFHAIGYGKHFATLGSNKTGIEAYASGRYFTFTGNTIKDDPLTCLAHFVEERLAPYRSKNTTTEPQNANNAGTVQVDPKTVTELRSALLHMRSDDRDLWVRMGHALHELGSTGRGLWLDWSATSESYDSKDAARVWDSFKPKSTGYQAVFAEAHRLGWVNPNSNAARAGSKQPTEIKPNSAPRELISRSLNNVQMKSIDWLWTGWIPKGYITIWAGESGAGKSTVLADVTARVSTGASWPGEPTDSRREPGRVLWLGSEDGTEELIVPRLVACGAQLENVTEIQGVMQLGKRNTFSMQDDLEAVSAMLEAAKKKGTPFSMLVIDPITSYLPGQKLKKVNLNDAGELRTVLEPWLGIAQRHGLAIVCVTHFTKDTTRSMLHRVLGSAAFAQTCRSLCAVVTRTDEGMYAKALIQVKVNLPEHPGGAWKFDTIKVPVGTDPRNQKPIDATRPEWKELDSALTPESVVGGERGPVSRYTAAFGMWVKAFFINTPAGDGLPVSEVRAAAIAARVATDHWFSDHSAEYLEKRNQSGEWYCRPKTPH